MDENNINSEIQSGNRRAVEQAFQLYYVELVRYALHILNDREGAQDVLQDCFARILTKPELWAGIQDIRGYLYRTVHNQSLWRMRDQRSNDKKRDLYNADKRSHLRILPEVMSMFDHRYQQDTVSLLLNLLTPARRTAVQLVYLEQLSYMDASRRMGISQNSLKTHLKLAKAMLRKALGNFEFMIIFLLLLL